MKYNIKKNWIETYGFIVKNPIVLMPFIIIAFLEGLALELIYFSAHKPLILIAGPIIRKFYGEAFLHYPGNILILPKIFYYKQIGIYIIFGTLMTAVSINIFKNIRSGLPVRTKALIRNVIGSYASLLVYGVIFVVILFALNRANTLFLSQAARIVNRYALHIPVVVHEITFTMVIFLTNVIIQSLIILTIPIIVIGKKDFLKAFAGSIKIGIKNFPTIFGIIFLPFLVYLPIMLLKSLSGVLANKTFPEISLCLTAFSIIIAIFLDSFIVLCATRFLMDVNKSEIENLKSGIKK